MVGLNVYINGNLEGADWTGVRKIRETDADTRVIIGRRNDFMGGYSNVYFKELAFREQFVEPWEAREFFRIYGRMQICFHLFTPCRKGGD